MVYDLRMSKLTTNAWIREWMPLFVHVTTLVVVFAIFAFGRWSCATNECHDVCEANGDESTWTFTAGCFCRDADGLYNPADSREPGR